MDTYNALDEMEQRTQRLRCESYVQEKILVEVSRTVYGRPELAPFLALKRQRSTIDYWVVGNIQEVDNLIIKLQSARDMLASIEKDIHNDNT